MKSRIYVIETAGAFVTSIVRSRPAPLGIKVHGAFKSIGGAQQFADAMREGEVITHAVAERRAKEALRAESERA